MGEISQEHPTYGSAAVNVVEAALLSGCDHHIGRGRLWAADMVSDPTIRPASSPGGLGGPLGLLEDCYASMPYPPISAVLNIASTLPSAVTTWRAPAGVLPGVAVKTAATTATPSFNLIEPPRSGGVPGHTVAAWRRSKRLPVTIAPFRPSPEFLSAQKDRKRPGDGGDGPGAYLSDRGRLIPREPSSIPDARPMIRDDHAARRGLWSSRRRWHARCRLFIAAGECAV